MTKIDINEKAIQMRLNQLFNIRLYNLYPEVPEHIDTFKWDFYQSYDK